MPAFRLLVCLALLVCVSCWTREELLEKVKNSTKNFVKLTHLGKAVSGELKESAAASSIFNMGGNDANMTMGGGGVMNIQDMTELHFAARDANLTGIKVAIQEGGIDINKLDSQNRTALHYAVVGSCLECVNWLIANGADLEAKTSLGHTPLLAAAEYGFLDIARALVKAGADVNGYNNDYTRPLHMSSVLGHPHIVQFLLDNKADIEILDFEEVTPLIFAAVSGQLRPLKVLIENGANLNHLDNNRTTAIMYAAYGGYHKCVEALLDAGADVTLADRWKRTALDLAKNALQRRVRNAQLCIDMLVEKGAPEGPMANLFNAGHTTTEDGVTISNLLKESVDEAGMKTYSFGSGSGVATAASFEDLNSQVSPWDEDEDDAMASSSM